MTKINRIPEELVENIISFACDRRGYNIFDYYQRVKDNEPRMKRIRLELLYWNKCLIPYNGGIGVSWLKPTRSQRIQSNKFKKSLRKGIPQIFYHTGCYLNEENEERATDELEMDDY